MGFQQPRFSWNLSFFILACFIMFLGFATFCLSTQKLWNPGNALLGTCNRFKEPSVENTSCDFIWPSAALFNQLFECCSPVHRLQLIRVVRVVQGKSCRATANKEGVWCIMYNLLLFWLGKPAASPATKPASASACRLFAVLLTFCKASQTLLQLWSAVAL